MTRKIKSIICSAIVVAIILSVSLTASAGTIGYFTKKTINNASYSYLTYSIKSTTSSQATARVTEVEGGSYATLKGGTSSSAAYGYGVSAGKTVTITLKDPYLTVGDAISLYGLGLQNSYSISGSWNAN